MLPGDKSSLSPSQRITRKRSARIFRRKNPSKPLEPKPKVNAAISVPASVEDEPSSRPPIEKVASVPTSVDDDPPSGLPDYYKNPSELVKEGDQIAVWWEGDKKFYTAVARNLRQDGKRRVEYDDGQVRYHDLAHELFHFSGKALEKFLESKFPEEAKAGFAGYPTAFPGLMEYLHIGDSVSVYWPELERYYPGKIAKKDKSGKYRIKYDDGDTETVKMEDESFRFIGLSATRVYSDLM